MNVVKHAHSMKALLTCNYYRPFISVLGDAIHFVLCGLRNCKLSDIVCQDMQRGSKQGQGPAAAVSVTLTFELPAADQGPARQTPRHISFTRSHMYASTRGSLTVQDAHGQPQQLSEVLSPVWACRA